MAAGVDPRPGNWQLCIEPSALLVFLAPTIQRMPNPADEIDLSAVPLFPLPNVVLFPRAVLPLHVFEERYKEMTADALRGNRQIAMALLGAGWETNYHGKPPI